MPRPRPAAVVVIAVLNLVFGGLGLFCTVCGGVMSVAGGDRALTKMADAEQQRRAEAQRHRSQITERIRAKYPLYRVYSVGNQVVTVLFSLALVASGIGLLYLQSWARWLAVGYAVLSILANLVDCVVNLVFLMPTEMEAFRAVPPANDQERIAYQVAQVVAPGMPCVLMLYPAVVLILLLLPSVGRAFRYEPRRARERRRDYEDEEPEDEDDDDRPRRRRAR
jgi:hypothetical protein